MSEFSVSLAKLAEEANLTIAYTPCELEKIQVTATEVYRPGILLAGYYENFDSKRTQQRMAVGSSPTKSSLSKSHSEF